jgi:hypothetical protein
VVQIKALQKTVTVGGSKYPIFIGFLSAADLVKIAEAPAFTDTTTHHQIATNILTPPIRDWQRPLDKNRVLTIADVYSSGQELMPNPVLLSQNALASSAGYTVTPHMIHNQHTGLFDIDIALPSPGQDKPLWILDGQHRINGLAQSAQSSNPIPLVLLLNYKHVYFAPPMLAKIFAQVTTEAQKLDNLHEAWLTYAFDLSLYNNNAARHNAMTVVAHLCSLPNVVSGDPQNPFFNRIRFNPHSTHTQSPQPGGFSYDCNSLAELFYKHYYNCAAQASGGHLPPHDLARHIVLAHYALTQVVQAPQDHTVFFADDPKYGQRIMQDAWFVGVLTSIRRHGPSKSWVTLFQTLHFDSTDWNFSSWVKSLGGKESTRSRTLALSIFSEIFSTGKPAPKQSNDLANYLQGDGAGLVVECFQVAADGKLIKASRVENPEPVAGTRSVQAGSNIFVRLRPATSNIAAIVAHDGTVKHGIPEEYAQRLKKGVLLDANAITKPWKLAITSIHYGGVTNQLSLTINW